MTATMKAAGRVLNINELLILIGEHVINRASLYALCLVSHNFNHVFTQFLYSRIVINDDNWFTVFPHGFIPLDEEVDEYRVPLGNTTSLSILHHVSVPTTCTLLRLPSRLRHVRSLVVSKCAKLGRRPMPDGSLPECPEPQRRLIAERINFMLRALFEHMPGLVNFTLTDLGVSSETLEALRMSCPKLQCLEVNVQRGFAPTFSMDYQATMQNGGRLRMSELPRRSMYSIRDFEDFSNLRILAISGIGVDWAIQDRWAHCIACICANSPGLSVLSLSMDADGRGRSFSSFFVRLCTEYRTICGDNLLRLKKVVVSDTPDPQYFPQVTPGGSWLATLTDPAAVRVLHVRRHPQTRSHDRDDPQLATRFFQPTRFPQLRAGSVFVPLSHERPPMDELRPSDWARRVLDRILDACRASDGAAGMGDEFDVRIEEAEGGFWHVGVVRDTSGEGKGHERAAGNDAQQPQKQPQQPQQQPDSSGNKNFVVETLGIADNQPEHGIVPDLLMSLPRLRNLWVVNGKELYQPSNRYTEYREQAVQLARLGRRLRYIRVHDYSWRVWRDARDGGAEEGGSREPRLEDLDPWEDQVLCPDLFYDPAGLDEHPMLRGLRWNCRVAGGVAYRLQHNWHVGER